MFVYTLELILCVFFAAISEKVRDKRSKILSLVPFIILFLISAIRYNVGIDYAGTYTEIYYKLINGITNLRLEYGFLLIYKIIIFLGLHLQWVFVISSFLINLFIYKSIEKISKNKSMSYYIFICSTFYFFSMNGIRQAIAMAIFYYSIRYIHEKKMIKFIILNLIGSLFHQSAIIFIPIYFLSNYTFKKKRTYIIILIGTFIFSSYIAPFFIQILNGTRYNLYFMNNNYNPLASLNLSSILNLLIFLAYLYKIDLKEKDSEENTYFICHFIAAIISAFMTTLPLVLRLFQSFRFIDFLSIPYLIETKVKKKKFWIILLIIGFYFAYFIYHIALNNANEVLPYRTIFG